MRVNDKPNYEQLIRARMTATPPETQNPKWKALPDEFGITSRSTQRTADILNKLSRQQGEGPIKDSTEILDNQPLVVPALSTTPIDAAKALEKYLGFFGWFRRNFTDKEGFKTAKENLLTSMKTALGITQETDSPIAISRPEGLHDPQNLTGKTQIAHLSTQLENKTLYIHKPTGYAIAATRANNIKNPDEWISVKKGPNNGTTHTLRAYSLLQNGNEKHKQEYQFSFNGLGQVGNVTKL